MTLQLLESEIIALFVETLFYGLYIATLLHTLRWLLFADEGWTRRRNIKWGMLGLTLLLFVSSTANLALAFSRALNALTHGPAKYTKKRPAAAIVMAFIVFLQSIIADSVLIYRCWAVSSKSWRIICLPVMLLMGDLACLILGTYWQASGSLFSGSLRAFILIWIVFWSCTIALTIYTTSAIVYCIWSVSKNSYIPRASKRRFRFAVRIIVESGLMYTTTTIMNFAAAIAGNSNAVMITSAMSFQVIGIAFNLIIIRVMKERVHGDDESRGSKVTTLHFRGTTTNSSTQSQDTPAQVSDDARPPDLQEPPSSERTKESIVLSVV
ncbi:hypothetical protein AX17_005457 [Amanita inopinata Kibby_2008]|nr:hypothetical protein AX17_005457 [Amanita inopinata Kibby_2008]